MYVIDIDANTSGMVIAKDLLSSHQCAETYNKDLLVLID